MWNVGDAGSSGIFQGAVRRVGQLHRSMLCTAPAFPRLALNWQEARTDLVSTLTAASFIALYTDPVRRLLQLGFLLLMVVTFVAPVAECFDQWDAPGLGNDTEFALFRFVFFMCLVLVVAMLVALKALKMQFASRLVPLRVVFLIESLVWVMPSPVPPHSSPPLRI